MQHSYDALVIPFLKASANRCRDTLAGEFPQVGTFGDRLKREREMRGISLDEMSHATKIGTRLLKALEEEDFQKLPGGIFNKGFVRAYAKFLGIDEDEAVTDYMEVAGEDPRATVNPDQLRKAAEKSISEKKQAAQPVRLVPGEDGASAELRWLPVGVFLLFCLALAAGGFQLYRHRGDVRESIGQRIHHLKDRFSHGKRPAQLQQQQISTVAAGSGISAPQAQTVAPQQQGSPVTAVRSAESGLVQGPSRTNEPSSDPGKNGVAKAELGSGAETPVANSEFALVIRAHEESWISIVADGEPAVRRILRPGGPGTTVKARGRIKLTAGNAGGVDLLVDGKPQPSIGRANEVRTVFVTANGVQQ
jgi:cytoskeleton protein RodZ